MSLNHVRISTRLIAAFGLVILILILMIISSSLKLGTISDESNEITDRNIAAEMAAKEISEIMQENGSRTLQLFITPDADERKIQYAAIATNKQRISDALKELNQFATSPGEKDAIAKMNSSRPAYVAAFTKVHEAIEQGHIDQAQELVRSAMLPALRQALADAQIVIDVQKKNIESNSATIRQSIYDSRIFMLTFGIIGAIISTVCALWITRSVTVPLNEAVAAAQRVAKGDLTATITVSSKDETGELMRALGDMNEHLASTLTQVHNATSTITTAASEIATGNADLSARTESQASSLEETASSMEELTSTVRQNADNARQANQLVISASDVASKGHLVVDQVVTTMGSIKDSSGKIVDIISVIDGIAFQTNILALNAAVEAARAGEQGRGFAVVASEVRNLAQRSAVAAKEIKSLIDDSVEKVDHGSKLVDQAGHTMSEIVSSVQHVADIMGEITSASAEQNSGIQQVNLAITKIDEMTQQNAALVEQAAAAAESMREQAQVLSSAVAVFQLAGVSNIPGTATSHKPPKTRPAQASSKKIPGQNKIASVPSTAKPKTAVAQLAKAGNHAQDTDNWTEF